MFTIKADAPNAKVTLTLPEVTDSEGNKIAVEFGDFLSDNDTAVSVLDNEDGTVELVFEKLTEDGEPNLANLSVNLLESDTQKVLKVYGAQVTIVHGDAANITGGGIAIEGFTEDAA